MLSQPITLRYTGTLSFKPNYVYSRSGCCLFFSGTFLDENTGFKWVQTSDIPVTETQTDTEMIDISKTHTETNTEKIFNTDTVYI